jgi:excinuclease ABC subunit C
MTILNVKEILKNIPHKPGIYQMLSEHREVLYVGKAKDLRKRVASYFRCTVQHPRTIAFLAQVVDIVTIITGSETEALLLEYSLIKSLKPRYNILLKDDRSYPYLFLPQHPFPPLTIYRGSQKEPGFYFGPFPSAYAAHDTRLLLQKIFRLRLCSDSMFKNRSRPCLQYQIGRCAAPCVGLISQDQYARNVSFVKMFLSGKSKTIIHDITTLMQNASQSLDFEQAALYRNQLASLQEIQKQHNIIQPHGDIDILAVAANNGHTCIDILIVRSGMVLGNQTFYEEYLDVIPPHERLINFLTQYYLRHSTTTAKLPQRLLTSLKLTATESKSLEDGIAQLLQQHIKIIRSATTKQYKQWLTLAIANAEHKLQQKMTTQQQENFAERFKELNTTLSLAAQPTRITCFDVSHHGGEATVVAAIVFGINGVIKDEYRRYNIKLADASDDYGALREALQRHFTAKIKLSATSTSAQDLLIIDGGKGQLQVATTILEQYQLTNLPILAIAKGDGRKIGNETIYFMPPPKAQPSTTSHSKHKFIQLADLPSQLFMFLLRIRDEAHRFAIASQRNNLRKRRLSSPLDSIPGIGKKRRDTLLRHFGGWQGIKAATIHDLTQVSGVNHKLAQGIYNHIHKI